MASFLLTQKILCILFPIFEPLPLERTINPSALSSKTFANQVCTCSESLQILHKGSVEILYVQLGVSSVDFPISLS